MRKVKITLPATMTIFGLGLALALYSTVEITERTDEQFIVDAEGEGAGRYGIGLRHPVALGLMRVFQQQQQAPLGLNIHINNHIPLDAGLGAESAFWAAGIIGANNLLGGVYTRAQLLELVVQASGHPDEAVTTVLGGLTTSVLHDQVLLYRSLPVAPLIVAVAQPDVPDYGPAISRARPERVPLADALYNLAHLPLLLEALRLGDLKLLAQVIGDRLSLPYLKPRITGYDHAVEMARRGGAIAVTLCGDGPALAAFADHDQTQIAQALELAFANAGVKARTWVLPVDTQGVVVSAAQTA